MGKHSRMPQQHAGLILAAAVQLARLQTQQTSLLAVCVSGRVL